MKRLFISISAILLLAPPALRGQTVWTNPVFGIINTAAEIPQSVNHIVNHGFISVATTAPFETFDTLSLTNTGTMTGVPGWRFNNVSSSTGTRRMAGSFVNLNAGMISALDSSIVLLPFPCEVARTEPSHLIVSATNIINRAVGPNGASLSVGANGGIELTGKNIDLTRGGLEVRPLWANPPGDLLITIDDEPVAYASDVAIHDSYWVQDSFNEDLPLFSAGLWNGFVATAPSIPGPPPAGPSQPVSTSPFSLVFPFADSYINFLPDSSGFIMVTNIIGDPTNVLDVITNPVFVVSNLTKGAVFVQAPQEFGVEIGFAGGEDFLNSIRVLLSTTITNAVTGLSDEAFIFLQDTLAADFDDRGIRTNVIGCPPVGARPLNYRLNRVNPPFGVGAPGNNGYPEPDFFISSRSLTINDPGNYGFDAVTNSILEEGDFAGYQAVLDNVVSRPPAVPGGTVTNLPGRIRIQSENLDMSRTRFRGEGEIIINASHLISSSNAIVDGESLSFNLTSTNGNLRVQNLSKDVVQRFRGPVRVFSAVWENSATLLITNNFAVSNIVVTNDLGDTITNTVAEQQPITNSATVTYHVLMVDGTSLQTILPVTVYDMVTRSTNTVINDNMSVVQNFLVDGESLTINGNVSIPGFLPPNPLTGLVPPDPALRSWTVTNGPNLRFFTNNGSLSVANVANFGQDRVTPYSTFVNSGFMNAASILVASDSFENAGTLTTLGGLFIRGGTGKLDGGSSFSGNQTLIEAMDVKFNNYELASGDVVTLMVTNSLTDAGAGSGSVLDATYGFNLPIKPAFGALLGTTFQSLAPNFWQTEHTWAAEDRGNSPAGFSNNAAVGTLLLATSDSFGGHFFRGAGSQNALYVDLLDISALGENYQEQLEIDPSLVIYFAAANVDFTTPADMQPEEFLDGQFGGRLRWASTFAGPNSSADVLLLNGTTIKVNRALRESLILDDDGDGVANGLDAFPFDEERWTTMLSVSSTPSGMQAELTWNAAPLSVYQIEYATNLLDLNWQPLMTCTNLGSSNSLMSILDTNINPAEQQRFYRVRLLQQ